MIYRVICGGNEIRLWEYMGNEDNLMDTYVVYIDNNGSKNTYNFYKQYGIFFYYTVTGAYSGIL